MGARGPRQYAAIAAVLDLLAGLALALSVNAARRPLERIAERILALGPDD